MSPFPDLLRLLPQVAKQVVPKDKAANVLLIPSGPVGTPKSARLVHTTPAKLSDDLPRRVVAVLGPGATFNGLAGLLLPHFTGATGIPPRTKALTADVVARALVAFARDLLPPPDGRHHHQVGLLLPLPIEVDGAGAWTVDVPSLHTLATEFVTRKWKPSIRTLPPTPLGVPEPARTESEARVLQYTAPPGSPDFQWQRALRNPSEAVLVFYALAQMRKDAGPAEALKFALAFLATAKAHHVSLLAATTAGNAILRRCRTALAGATPAGVDAAKHTAAKSLVDNALFQGPVASRTLVPHRDVTQTVDLLGPMGTNAQATPGARTDPSGGLHRIVFGRDVAVGREVTTKAAAASHTGPELAGRLDLDTVVGDDRRALRIADPRVEGALVVRTLRNPPPERLDAARSHDTDVLTIGMGAWSAIGVRGLAEVLFRFKSLAPDDFDLHFGLHGLDVDRVDPVTHRLREIGPSGASSPLTTRAAIQAFFGGMAGTGGAVRFDAAWVARFRLAALASRTWRRAQLLQISAQVTPTADPVELAIANVGPFPDPYPLLLDAAPTGRLQREVDSHAGALLEAKKAGGVVAADTLSGVVIDLTTPGVVAYANTRDLAPPRGVFPTDDRDTFYVGSMGKAVALYAAFEYRHRLRKARDAAVAAHMSVAAAGWHVPFLAKVERTWSARMTRGFPGFDTGSSQYPQSTTMFAFAPGGDIDFTTGTASDDDIKRLNLGLPDPTTMKFRELLKSMIFMSNATAAGQVIDAVGYPYLNGLLREAGFFDPATQQGIWESANYDVRNWRSGPDVFTLSARGRAHYKPETNHVGNAQQYARLLALARTNKLFDGNATACGEMIDIMRRGGPQPRPDRSFVRTALREAGRSVGRANAKIGIGVASPVHGRVGMHDSAIIERTVAGTALRYVMVIVGGVGTTLFNELVLTLDDAIQATHP